MPSVAFIPQGVSHYSYGINHKEVCCPYYQKYIQTGMANSLKVIENADMSIVVPNRINMDISVKKCDRPPKYPQDDLQKYVENVGDKYLAPMLKQRVAHFDDTVEFNLSSSPSSFWKNMGCKTKGDVLKHPLFHYFVFSIFILPIIDVNPKVEYKELIEILQGKIRTTFNPQFDFNVKMKILYDRQNNALKKQSSLEKSWIKYGFNKTDGGFHRQAIYLEQFDYHDEGDVSGFDRECFLRNTYMRRNKFLQFPPVYFWLVCYVFAFILHSYIKCPDGVVRVRLTGNDSGRNNTTADNCLFHVIVLFRFICRLWLELSKFKRLPELSEILYYHHYLVYSDDHLGSHRLKLLEVDEQSFIKLKAEVYAEFGMELKAKQTFVSSGIGRLNPRHSFLGSHFVFDCEWNMYCPFPRINKICSSLYYKIKEADINQVIMKTCQLAIISVPEPWLHDELVGFLNFLLQNYAHKQNVLPADYIAMALNVSQNSRAWYLHLLGKQSVTFSFREDGGVKECMTAKVARAQNILDRIARSTGLSKAGEEWLVAALDPCHDGKLECCGYPDQADAPTVVQVIKQTAGLSSPAGFGNDTWGFHVMVDDYLSTETNYCDTTPSGAGGNYSTIAGSLVQSNNTSGHALSAYTHGGVQVLAFDQTANGTTNITTWPLSGPGTANQIVKSMQVDFNNFLPGKTRLISQGVEVVNTTAQLYKGGSILCYEQPCSKQDTETFNYYNISAALDENDIDPKKKKAAVPVIRGGPLTATWDNMPPKTISEAMILPKTQQWGSEDGAYVVQYMNDMCNEPSFVSVEKSLYADQELVAPLVGAANIIGTFIPGFIPSDGLPEFLPGYAVFTYNKKCPFNKKGIVAYGLTPQSAFTLNLVTVIEREISSQDQSLSVLAKMSPPLDPIALGIYSAIVGDLPVGVRFSDNDFGEWFLGVVDEISNVVSSIGKPILSAVGEYQNSRHGNDGVAYSLKPPVSQPQKVKALPPIPNKIGNDKKAVANAQAKLAADRARSKPLPPTPKKKKPVPPLPLKRKQ